MAWPRPLQLGVGHLFPLLASTNAKGILFRPFLPFLRGVTETCRRMGVAEGVAGTGFGCLGGLLIFAESGVMVLFVLLVSESEN